MCVLFLVWLIYEIVFITVALFYVYLVVNNLGTVGITQRILYRICFDNFGMEILYAIWFPTVYWNFGHFNLDIDFGNMSQWQEEFFAPERALRRVQKLWKVVEKWLKNVWKICGITAMVHQCCAIGKFDELLFSPWFYIFFIRCWCSNGRS